MNVMQFPYPTKASVPSPKEAKRVASGKFNTLRLPLEKEDFRTFPKTRRERKVFGFIG